MKQFTFLFTLLSLTTVYACMDDDDLMGPGNISTRIDFVAQYDGVDLAIQSAEYDYPSGAKLKTGLFQYYVSDLELVDTDGNTIGLSDIELIRYGSPTDDATESRVYDIPSGDYVKIRFGLGVKPDLNAMDPNNFSANDPLNENEFWNASTRYVFAKIEANADLENNGTFDTGLSYHMGSDAVYTTIEFEANFTIDGNGDRQITIVADVLKALSDGTNTFDIANTDQQTVHGGNQAVAQDIWDRLSNQFTLELR